MHCIGKQFVSPMISVVLEIMPANVPDGRELEVLSLFPATVNEYDCLHLFIFILFYFILSVCFMYLRTC